MAHDVTESAPPVLPASVFVAGDERTLEASRRGVEARVAGQGLDDPESIRRAIRRLARVGMREASRLERGEPKRIPPLLISSTGRQLEVLLSDALARGDLLEVKREAMKRSVARAG